MAPPRVTPTQPTTDDSDEENPTEVLRDPTRPRAGATLVDPRTNAATLPGASRASPPALTPVRAEPAPPEVDDPSERYAAGDVIGAGGMGEVRLCTDRRIGRDVAMKFLRKEYAQSAPMRRRFEREARIQGQLEHPSIVPVYDLRAGGSGPYFTMKRVRGHTLEEILDGLAARDPTYTERYSTRKLLAAFGQAALAVAFAHARGVLHRDLKPGNLMLGDFGEVYVLDWGLAKVAGDALAVESDEALRNPTAPGVVMGTPGYMSPEQARGELDKLDARSDVYSLGAILFEILALRPLHDVEGVPALLVSTVKGVDARPSVRAPDRNAPLELDAVCARACAVDPADRYPTVRALVSDVERFLDGDRDTERRREQAAQHLAEGKAAADRAASATGDNAARARALRELNRALALDPSNTDAVGVMARVLLSPPAETPPEAEAELRRSLDEERRHAARIGAVALLSWLALAPLLLVSGIREWFPYALLAVLIAASSALSRWLAVRARPVSDAGAFAVLAASTAAIGVSAMYLGPLVLVPAVTSQNTLVFALNARPGARRYLTIAFGGLAFVAPLALEAVGLLAPSMAFRDGALVILPRMTGLPAVPTTALLVIASLAILVVPSLVVARAHDEGVEAKRKIFTLLWHLRQLVPDAARAPA